MSGMGPRDKKAVMQTRCRSALYRVLCGVAWARGCCYEGTEPVAICLKNRAHANSWNLAGATTSSEKRRKACSTSDGNANCRSSFSVRFSILGLRPARLGYLRLQSPGASHGASTHATIWSVAWQHFFC